MNKKQLLLIILILILSCASCAKEEKSTPGSQENFRDYQIEEMYAEAYISPSDAESQGIYTDLDPGYTKVRYSDKIEMDYVYIGMPMQELERAGYTKDIQKAYYQVNNEEWIIFSNWTTEEPKGFITFYVVDGKVKGWKKHNKDEEVEILYNYIY